MLKKRILGRTGRHVSIVALGGAGLGHLNREEADKSIQLALDHGVNMVDVAPSYGDAEARLGPWLQKYRNHFFLAEKTLERSREGAWKDLNASLGRLGVKAFDLYQMHAVRDFGDLDRALEERGAIGALKEAKETGLTKYIGLTGHADVRVHIKAIQMFDFDTLLLPVSASALVSPTPANDFRPVLKVASERGLGVVAIKSIAKRKWKGEKRYSTWYEPSDVQKEIDRLVWFTLSQNGVAAYSIAGDTKLWPKVIDAAERYRRLSEKEQVTLIGRLTRIGFEPLF